MTRSLRTLAMTLGLAGITMAISAPARSAEALNIYTSRHYQTDETLYRDFTAQTGIEINRIEGKGNALIERLKSEGANSPADVLITVDVAMLWRADQAKLFKETSSSILEQRVPEILRHPKGRWFGLSKRARLIFYNKDEIGPGDIVSYEDLADPKWRGKVCIRSSGNVYNLSLLGSIIASRGEAAAQAWAKGVVANFARDPQGGDTDQLRATAAGQCAVSVANSYYYVRLLSSAKESDRKVAASLGIVFPNQDGRGTHVNISGAGVLASAKHGAAAIRFIEYLTSEAAQRIFADGNNEYPVVEGVATKPELAALGGFKQDTVSISSLGENQPLAQRIFDRAGWK